MDRVLAAPSSGTPIPPEVRRRVEPHVGVDLGAVRVLTGPRAAVAAASLGARAFTAGSTVVLGRGESAGDTRLMAHEAAHVAQQAGGPDRSAVHRTTIMRDLFEGPLDLPDLPDISVSDLVPQSIVDGVTDALRSIPGYRLLTQVIGTDPLTGEPVEADRQAMIDELLSYGPFGAAVGQALQGMHALGDVVTVVTDTLGQYRLTFTRLKADVDAAWEQFSVTNGIDGNVAIVARVIDGILADVRRFVTDLAERILAIVREAVLGLVEKLLTQDPAIAPVWSLATKVFHHDPLRGVPVEAATVDILADFLHLIGQDAALDQMRERGTLQQTADWLDTQFETFLELLHQATTLFGDAWAAIQPENLGTLLDTLPGLAQRAFTLIAGIGSFAGTVLAEVLALVKRSLLGMLSEHAHAIPGFRLISVIIGRNPFTDDEVARTAENLIGGFITLLPGGEATYQQLSETGVIGEAAARIESAMATLGITPDLVTRTFLGLWDTLSLEDLLTPVDAFERVVALFGEPIGRIVEFVTVVVQVVVELVLRLMNFPSELLASIVTQTVQAIGDIRRDPVGFLLHMLEALKAGFQGFFDHALDHLVQGLVSWLFRGLSQLGITIPTEISFASILGLVLEVLGLSMDFVWRKLGEHVGEERVAMIRENLDRLGQAWGFAQDVQERGVVAIWEYVADRLSTLWSTILSMASEWIMSTIVTNGLTKLLSFLDPSGIMAVVNSCIAFFNAVQSAIEYVHDILQIVDTFVSTLAAVARGDIAPGAQMIEQGLAASIPVALGFLAAQLGLGNVPDKIAEIIRSVREVVEAAIDWLIQQALRLGAAALNALGGDAVRRPGAGEASAVATGSLAPDDAQGRLVDAVARANALLATPGMTVEFAREQLPTIVSDLGLKALEIRTEDATHVRVHAEINPVLDGPRTEALTDAQLNDLWTLAKLYVAQMRNKATLARYQAMSAGERWKFFDPKETSEGVSKISSGRMVEFASASLVRDVMARDASGAPLTCLENVRLQVVDSGGLNIGGEQSEIDFLLLGQSSVVKVVSAKLAPKQLRGMRGKAISQLTTYNDVTLPPMPADLNARFGGGPATYAAAADVHVRWKGGSLPLGAFRAQYLANTVVTTVVVEGVVVGPDLGDSAVFHLAVDRARLMKIMADFADAVIAGSTTRPRVPK